MLTELPNSGVFGEGRDRVLSPAMASRLQSGAPGGASLSSVRQLRPRRLV